MPGVQIPHWAPPVCRNAACRSFSRSLVPSPSTVSTLVPSTWQIGTRQESTTAPSSMTLHAPHSPSPQPSFVPVSARSSRRTSSSRRIPGTSTSTEAPLTLNRKLTRHLAPALAR